MGIVWLIGAAVALCAYGVGLVVVRITISVTERGARRAERRRLRENVVREVADGPHTANMLLVVAAALVFDGSSLLRIPVRIAALVVTVSVLAQVVVWIIHAVPGHSRTVKYVILIASSGGLASTQSLWVRGGSTTISVIWVAWMTFVVVAAFGFAIAVLGVATQLGPHQRGASAALRWHHSLTWLQGPDVMSLVVWFALSITGLAPGYLVLRFCLGERMKTRPFLYLRSFSQQDASEIFGAVVMPALYRWGAVSGLVHSKQSSTKLHKALPALWRARFQTVADEGWKAWVEHALGHCTGVVLDLSTESDALKWELECATRTLGSDRILILGRHVDAKTVARWGSAVAGATAAPPITRVRRPIPFAVLAIPVGLTVGAFSFATLVEHRLVFNKRPARMDVTRNVKRIAMNAVDVWKETGKLPPSVDLTPPVGSCCSTGTGECQPQIEQWQNESWQALSFSIDSPHAYSYAFETGSGTFTVKAVGDLDCDGDLATFELVGTMIDGRWELSPLTATNEIE